MQRQYNIDGYIIKVTFKAKSIHIDNDVMLWNMLNAARLVHSRTLIAHILDEFEKQQGRTLAISSNSLIIEVWAHVYIDYFAKVLDDITPLNLLASVKNAVGRWCDVIDCGEQGVDNNRFLWDMLSGQVDRIHAMLPDKIDTKHRQ
jgi:hypothetical protein